MGQIHVVMKSPSMMTAMMLVSLVLLVHTTQAQEAVVSVSNPASFDRPLETIELSRADLNMRMHLLTADSVAVLEHGKEIVSQLIDLNGDGLWDELVFQSGLTKHQRKQFTIRKMMPQPSPEEPRAIASAKYILPRKDIAWENDRIAHRIYGSILAGNVLDGIDVWVKRVRYPIIDKWYNGDSLPGAKRISYHVDHGEGADMFNVGSSLGDGGCALWSGDGYIQNRFFSSYRIIASGPVRTMFTVTYDSSSVNGVPFTEVKTYMLDAGTNLTRVEVTFTGLKQRRPADVAIGLVKRPHTKRFGDAAGNWMSLWGPMDEDSTHGALGIGVVVPRALTVRASEVSDHYLLIAQTTSAKKFTYFTGAGWTKSGDFADAPSWNEYLSSWARRCARPLTVSIAAPRNRGKP